MSKQLYLGQQYIDKKPTREKMYINTEDLLTHIFICGATGSGKTVLGKILIEEAALAGIPSIIIDLKGDLSSLAIPYSKLDKNDIEPWIDARTEAEKKEKASQTLKFYKANMVRSELHAGDIQRFRRKTNVRIFTPKSLIGVPLSLSPLAKPSFDVQELYKNDRETFLNLVGTVTDSIFERIFLEEERNIKIEERTYLEEIITHLWLKGHTLEGKGGIIELIKAVITPPVETIGIMKPADFLCDERRNTMAKRLNKMLVGSESLWYEGEPILSVLDDIPKHTDKTPVTIFNLSHLDTFEERNLVVSQIAYTIYSWMRKKIDSSGPRLVFYIDEIGGGKQAFFPEEPHQNSSKSAINLLLRQGRAFGVCCILSTQNPGDIDYRGLTNCQTWFVGKLLTETDREKIIQGLMDVSFVVKHFEEFIKTAETGDFAVKFRGGNINHFKERWLLTYHKVLTGEEFPFLKKILMYDHIISEARQIMHSETPSASLKFLENKIREHGKVPKLLIAMGDVAKKINKNDLALNFYREALAIQPSDIAYYKVSVILAEMKDFDNALENLRNGLEINHINEYIHMEMGKIYQILGMLEQAEESFTTATKINMNLEQAWNLRGWLMVEIVNPAEAIRCFERAITLNKDNPDNRTGLALASHINGSTVQAMLDLTDILEIFPDNKKALYHKSQIHLELNEIEDAVKCSEKLIKLEQDNPHTWFNHGKILVEAEKFKEAVPVLKKSAKLDSSSGKTWNLLSKALLNTGDTANAISSSLKSVSVSKESPDFKYDLALIYRTADKTKEEIQVLSQMTEEFPKYIKSFIDLSWYYVKNGELEDAITLLNKALSQSAGNEELLYNKAEILFLMGNNSEVLKLVNTINTYQKINPGVLLLKGKVLEEENKIMESLTVLSEGISLFPKSKELHKTKGKILLNEKRFRDADESFSRALKIDENDPEILESMGEVKKAMFDDNGAEEFFKKAEELRNNSKKKEVK